MIRGVEPAPQSDGAYNPEKIELQRKVKDLSELAISLSHRSKYTDKENAKWYEFECECGFKGLSLYATGGGQIADTGDYGSCHCPVCERNVD